MALPTALSNSVLMTNASRHLTLQPCHKRPPQLRRVVSLTGGTVTAVSYGELSTCGVSLMQLLEVLDSASPVLVCVRYEADITFSNGVHPMGGLGAELRIR